MKSIICAVVVPASRKMKSSGSIHAPAKGATDFYEEAAALYLISIHAPAKGATALNKTSKAAVEISIHAPAKGATRR